MINIVNIFITYKVFTVKWHKNVTDILPKQKPRFCGKVESSGLNYNEK